MLTVVDGLPPNYEAIIAVCPTAATPGVIFAYAPLVYMPGATRLGVKVLSRELDAHERVHIERQGNDPEAWWKRYLAEPAFRFEEELLAHQAEYETYRKRHAEPGKRHRALVKIASRLASALYGSLERRERCAELILNFKPVAAA